MKKILLLLKGMAMGGADVIPGVSGGTIALITGIYEELINSIKSVDGTALKLLLKLEFKKLWERVNGSFLLIVFSGVLISIFSLAKLITYLLEYQPIPLWSFFFGLILVSAFYVMPRQRSVAMYVFLVIGVASAYAITTLSPANTPEAYWFIFLSGAIAICAMILPGISGSFILLLLGKYEYILEAVKAFDLGTILVFGLGCLIGLVAFSKFIHWLLQSYKVPTLAMLAGFMLGSLNKIWPWKLDDAGAVWSEESLSDFINVSPFTFTSLAGEPNQLSLAIIFCLLGIAIVVVLEWIGKKLA